MRRVEREVDDGKVVISLLNVYFVKIFLSSKYNQNVLLIKNES